MNTQQLLQGPAVGRNISLPSELNRALEAQAKREDRSVSRIVRRALVLYLQSQVEHEPQTEPA